MHHIQLLCSLCFSLTQNLSPSLLPPSLPPIYLGTISKLWSHKRLIFKQCLIYTCLSFKNVGFNNESYFLLQIKQAFLLVQHLLMIKKNPLDRTLFRL